MKIVFFDPVSEQYERIQEPHKSRIRKKIAMLSEHGLQLNAVKALTGEYAGDYRLRAGSYRILFSVEGDTAQIYSIKHRRDVYD